jgi:hypothetical protein
VRAISLWQPWASAVAIGAKTIETRHWWTAYRGPLAIHAAKKDTPELREFFTWKACDPLRRAGYERFDQLPFGAIVATCRLTECLRSDDVAELTDQERALGDYSPGRYAWVFVDVEPLGEPIPFRGSQGFFEWPAVDKAPGWLPGL